MKENPFSTKQIRGKMNLPIVCLCPMNPKTLKYLSYLGVTVVMALSAAYFYKTWQRDEPRWYFMILAIGIAILLSYNLLSKKR